MGKATMTTCSATRSDQGGLLVEIEPKDEEGRGTRR